MLSDTVIESKVVSPNSNGKPIRAETTFTNFLTNEIQASIYAFIGRAQGVILNNIATNIPNNNGIGVVTFDSFPPGGLYINFGDYSKFNINKLILTYDVTLPADIMTIIITIGLGGRNSKYNLFKVTALTPLILNLTPKSLTNTFVCGATGCNALSSFTMQYFNISAFDIAATLSFYPYGYIHPNYISFVPNFDPIATDGWIKDNVNLRVYKTFTLPGTTGSTGGTGSAISYYSSLSLSSHDNSSPTLRYNCDARITGNYVTVTDITYSASDDANVAIGG